MKNDDINIYVDSYHGNDNYPGTYKKPLSTIDEVFRRLPTIWETNVIINLGPGEYNLPSFDIKNKAINFTSISKDSMPIICLEKENDNKPLPLPG